MKRCSRIYNARLGGKIDSSRSAIDNSLVFLLWSITCLLKFIWNSVIYLVQQCCVCDEEVSRITSSWANIIVHFYRTQLFLASYFMSLPLSWCIKSLIITVHKSWLSHDQTRYQIWAKSRDLRRSYCDFSTCKFGCCPQSTILALSESAFSQFCSLGDRKVNDDSINFHGPVCGVILNRLLLRVYGNNHLLFQAPLLLYFETTAP